MPALSDVTIEAITTALAGSGSSLTANALAKMAETLTGFDREDIDVGGKSTGILQFCMSASSGDVHQIGSDEAGIYVLLTGQTTFADGTALADRTLMQYHDSGETHFSYWRHGVLVEETGAKFIQLAAGFKGYVGYDSAGDMDDTITDARALIIRTPLIAYMYLNNTKSTVEWFADERHGQVMSGQTHLQQHMSTEFFHSTGLDITGIANNVATFTAIGSGSAGDEDIKMMFSSISTAPKIYMEGVASEWTITDDDANLAIFSGGKACYNDISGTPALVEIDNDRVVMTAMATNNKIHPVVWLVGQDLHATRGVARIKANSDYFRIKTAGMPSHEFFPIGSVIVNDEANGYCEIGADDELWIDHRQRFPVMRF